MIKSYKVRLFPTKEQEELFWKHVNCCRFIWNWGLNKEMNSEKYISGFSLKKEVTKLKESNLWLNEVSSQSLALTILDLDIAYKRMLNKISKHPKFKSKKKETPRFPIRYDRFYFTGNSFNIEKVGKVKTKTKMKLPIGKDLMKYSNPRIKFINNKWILSFGIEVENQDNIKLTEMSMGIDLGIKDLAIVSNGNNIHIYKNINKTKRIKALKSKLKHLQKNVSRKYETNNKNKVYASKWVKSKSILKYEKMIADVYYKLSNIRKDYTHKTTTELIRMLPYRIVLEDLNVLGIMKNRHLSKAIQEQTLYEFRKQIEYKALFCGIEVVFADRFFPSSKTCCECGNIKKDLKLKDRIYKCECGNVIDRDINASINLMNYLKVNK